MVALSLAFVYLWFASSSATLRSEHAVDAVDGDTLVVEGQTIDLYGIDAPEIGQLCLRGHDWWRCGIESAQALKRLVNAEGTKLVCTKKGHRANAVVASCQSIGQDISKAMLESGMAMALPDSSKAYQEAAARARDARLGLWSGIAVPPWQWRNGHRLAGEGDALSQCGIKAMAMGRNLMFYYVPTDPEYETLKVDLSRGDRLFCSDEDARSRGWVRPTQ